MTTSAVTPAAPSLKGLAKPILWTIFALGLLAVFLFYDLPILNPANPAHARMLANRLYLIPHIPTAIATILIGPLQFSTRFRRKYLRLHRLFGKIYVICVMIAAPAAVGIARNVPTTLFLAAVTQAVLWVFLTLAAFITARNRQVAQHRRWMIRSYGVGCTIFVLTRVTGFIPGIQISPDQLSFNIMLFIILSLALPEFYFGWHEITTSRAAPTTS
jgi:uncharacterized membrane protein